MPQAIDRKDVQRLMGEGAQVVEVLPREEFEEDHLPGAISLPLRSLETEAKGRLARRSQSSSTAGIRPET